MSAEKSLSEILMETFGSKTTAEMLRREALKPIGKAEQLQAREILVVPPTYGKLIGAIGLNEPENGRYISPVYFDGKIVRLLNRYNEVIVSGELGSHSKNSWINVVTRKPLSVAQKFFKWFTTIQFRSPPRGGAQL